MRTVGKRKERPVSFSASAELLGIGVKFNDGLLQLPGGSRGFIPKGVYHFKTLEEANAHWQDCLAKGIARLAGERK